MARKAKKPKKQKAVAKRKRRKDGKHTPRQMRTF